MLIMSHNLCPALMNISVTFALPLTPDPNGNTVEIHCPLIHTIYNPQSLLWNLRWSGHTNYSVLYICHNGSSASQEKKVRTHIQLSVLIICIE